MALPITTIDQLKQEAYKENGDFVEFFIVLAGGLAKSYKRISYRPAFNEFLIIHEIDESFEEVMEEELLNGTILGEAMVKGCFYCC